MTPLPKSVTEKTNKSAETVDHNQKDETLFLVIDAGSSSYKLNLIRVYKCENGLVFKRSKKKRVNVKLATVDFKLAVASLNSEILLFLQTNAIRNDEKINVLFGATAGFRALDSYKQKERVIEFSGYFHGLQSRSESEFKNINVVSLKVLSAYEEGLYSYVTANFDALQSRCQGEILHRIFEIGGYSAQIGVEDHQCLEPSPAFRLDPEERCFEISMSGRTRGIRLRMLENFGINRTKVQEEMKAVCPVFGEKSKKYGPSTYENCSTAVAKLIQNMLGACNGSVLPILSNVQTHLMGSPVYVRQNLERDSIEAETAKKGGAEGSLTLATGNSGVSDKPDSLADIARDVKKENAGVCAQSSLTKSEILKPFSWLTPVFITNLKRECETPLASSHDICYQGIFATEFLKQSQSLHENHVFTALQDASWEDGFVLEATMYLKVKEVAIIPQLNQTKLNPLPTKFNVKIPTSNQNNVILYTELGVIIALLALLLLLLVLLHK